jgi:hypothetical protein
MFRSVLSAEIGDGLATDTMMGDTNVETVMRHYFNLDVESMAEMVTGWSVPQVPTAGENVLGGKAVIH